MFDLIAARYDLLNRMTSLGLDGRWRRRLVAALAPAPGMRVLDLATGTADVAIAVLDRQPRAQVVGVDPSPCMLARAGAKVRARGLGAGIRLLEGDACDLPFRGDSFDAAAIAFGIRNVPDRARALAEMARVVRPAGRVAVLELTEPQRGVLAHLVRWHIHRVVPALGGWLSRAGRGKDAYRYLERSIAAFPAPAAFARLMAASGLEPERLERLCFGAVHLFVARPRVARPRVAQVAAFDEAGR